MMTRTDMLLQILQEELAEAIQAASKCQRFGFDEVWGNADKNPEQLSNVQRLQNELQDVETTKAMLRDEGVPVYASEVRQAHQRKVARIETYLDYSQKMGRMQ